MTSRNIIWSLFCCAVIFFFLRGIGKQILKFSYLALSGMTTLHLVSTSFIKSLVLQGRPFGGCAFLEEESQC